MSIQKYILATNEDLSSIFIPLKSTQRIKYTCFDISSNFLIFGATSGGIYLFKRFPSSFLQLIPNKDGSISQLAISPDEKLIGYATIKGTVVIVERNSSVTNNRVTQCTEHQGNQITYLLWSASNNEIYIGDDSGRVSVLHVSLFLGTNMFQTPWYQLMELDSRIVQLDCCKEYLLISTLTRSYLCNITREEFKQVGQKMRDGEFGGCFLNCGYGYRIYCARPGGRLWEVDFEAAVQNTHHYKPTLLSTTPDEIHDILHRDIFINSTQQQNQTSKNYNFTKVLTILSKFLITYNAEGLYILDINISKVLLWNCQLKNIKDIKILDESIYIQLTTTGMLYKMNLFDLEQFFINLYITKYYEYCIENLIKYKENIYEQIENFEKLHIICDMNQKMPTNLIISKEIDELLTQLANIYEKRKQERLQTSTTTVSASASVSAMATSSAGIVVVDNCHKSSTSATTTPSIDWKPVIDAFADETPTKLFNQLLQITTNQQPIVNFNDYFSQKQIATMREIITKTFRTKWIVQHYFVNSTNIDNEISEFVYKLITLLDLKTILDDLVGLELESFFKSTWSILNGIKNIPISTSTTTTTFESSKSLPHRLNIAYCLLESDQIDSFIQYTHGINTKLIFYLFIHLMTPTTTASSRMDKVPLFLSYLDKCESALIAVLNDKEMSDYFMDIYLEYYNQPGLSCQCNYPLMNSDYQEDLNYGEIRKRQRLGSLLLSHRRNDAEEICAQVPSLWPNLLLIQRSEPVNKVLSIVVQLGIWTSFEPWIMRMSLIDWKKLLSLQAECRNRCLGCQRHFSENDGPSIAGLPWSQIGIALVRHLGPKDALQLLTQYQDIIPTNQLNAKFYQSLLLVALVETKETGLRDSLIDSIHRGGKSPLFSNQIANLVSKALQSDNDLRVPKSDQLMRHSSSSSSSSSCSLENEGTVFGAAWGVHLDLATTHCPVCSVPLDSRPGLEEGGGLTLFQCGHSYHTLCFNRANRSTVVNRSNNTSSPSCPLCYQTATRD